MSLFNHIQCPKSYFQFTHSHFHCEDSSNIHYWSVGPGLKSWWMNSATILCRHRNMIFWHLLLNWKSLFRVCHSVTDKLSCLKIPALLHYCPAPVAKGALWWVLQCYQALKYTDINPDWFHSGGWVKRGCVSSDKSQYWGPIYTSVVTNENNSLVKAVCILSSFSAAGYFQCKG